MAEAVRVLEMLALRALVITTEPELTITQAVFEIDALRPFVTTTEPELTIVLGELSTLTESWLLEFTATESTRSVILIGQEAAGQAAVPCIAEAVRVLEIEALRALVTTVEPEETMTQAVLLMLALRLLVTTIEPELIMTQAVLEMLALI